MSDLDWLMRVSKNDPAPTDTDYAFKFIGLAVTGILICIILGGGLAVVVEVIDSTILGLDSDFSNVIPFLKMLPLLLVLLVISWFVYNLGSKHLSGRW